MNLIKQLWTLNSTHFCGERGSNLKSVALGSVVRRRASSPAPSSAFADTLNLLFQLPRSQDGSPGRVAASKGGSCRHCCRRLKRRDTRAPDETLSARMRPGPRSGKVCSGFPSGRGPIQNDRGVRAADRFPLGLAPRWRSARGPRPFAGPGSPTISSHAGFREMTLPVRARSALLRRSARIQATSRARGAAILSVDGAGRISLFQSPLLPGLGGALRFDFALRQTQRMLSATWRYSR